MEDTKHSCFVGGAQKAGAIMQYNYQLSGVLNQILTEDQFNRVEKNSEYLVAIFKIKHHAKS